MKQSNNDFEIKIEVGIPMPPRFQKNTSGGLISQALSRLLPDESFFVPFTVMNFNSLSATRTIVRAKTGNIYAMRRVVENEEKGSRIWRIA